MTFNEADVNRKQDGKFGEKTGARPEIDLPRIDARAIQDDFMYGIPNPLDEALDREWEERGRALAEAKVLLHTENIAKLEAGVDHRELDLNAESDTNDAALTVERAFQRIAEYQIATRGRSDHVTVRKVAERERAKQ